MSNINITSKSTGKISVSVKPSTPVTISPKAQTNVSIKGVVGATHDLSGTDFGFLYKSGDNKISTSVVTYDASTQIVTFPSGINPLTIYDQNDSKGTSGQILSSTGTSLDWISLTEIAGVNGTGTANYVAKWTDGDSITDSSIYDNGTNVGIGTAAPVAPLHVTGGFVSGASTTSGLYFNPANDRLHISNQRVLERSGAYIYLGYNATNLIFRTNNTEAARFTNNGRLGIGTTSVSYPLVVARTGSNIVASFEGNENTYLRIARTGTQSGESQIRVTNNGNTAFSADGSLSLKSGGVSALTGIILTTAGNVGIGTTSPNSKFEVNVGTDQNVAINSFYNLARISSYNDAFTASRPLRINGSDLRFDINSSEKIRISGAGNLGIGTTNPSEKLHVAGNAKVDGTLFIDNTKIIDINGQVYIDNLTNGGDISIRTRDDQGGVDTGILINGTNKTVSLHYNTIAKLTTAVDGIDIVGNVNLNSGSYLKSSTRTNILLDRSSDARMVFNTLYQSSTTGGYDFTTGSTSRMLITGEGKVGIGTTSPRELLEITKFGNPANIRLNHSGGTIGTDDILGSIQFSGEDVQVPEDQQVGATISGVSETGWGAGSEASTAIVFSTRRRELDAPIEYMRLNHLGNVGIGTASPSAKTEIVTTDVIDVAETSIGLKVNADQTGTSGTGGGTKYGVVIESSQNFNKNLGTRAVGLYIPAYDGTVYAGDFSAHFEGKLYLGGNDSVYTANAFGLLTLDGSATTDNVNDNTIFIRGIGISGEAGVLGGITTGTNTANASSAIHFVSGGTTRQSHIVFKSSRDGSLAERMRITDEGNVGIGTTSPTAKLEVKQADNADIQRWYSNNNLRAYINKSGDFYSGRFRSTGGSETYPPFSFDGAINTGFYYSSGLRITVGGTTRALIDTSGNVGIGTDAPDEKLHVEGNLKVTGTTTFESDLTVSGNLTVNGTTTTLNTTELTIEDKNIVLASGAADATAANGAGITIDGADATLTYNSTNDRLYFNKDVVVDKGVTNQTTKLDDTGLYISRTSDGGYSSYVEGNDNHLLIRARSNITLRSHESDVLIIKDSNDSVGIGTTSPQNKLHVYESIGENVARFESNTTYADLLIKSDNGTAYVSAKDGNLLLNREGNNVGIGTDNPASTLHTVGKSTEDIATLGTELLNAQTASGTGWTGTDIEQGYTHTPGNSDRLVTTFIPTPHKVYLIDIAVTGLTAGRIDFIYLGGQERSVYVGNTASRKVAIRTTTTDPLEVLAQTATDGTISFLSIKEVELSSASVTFGNPTDDNALEIRVPNFNSVYIGNLAGARRTDVFNTANTGIGFGSLTHNVEGTNNTAIGFNTLNSTANSSYNVAIGNNNLQYYKKAGNTYNIAIGNAVMYGSDITTASGNIMLGFWSGGNLTTANGNVGIGYDTFRNLTSGNSNISLGGSSSRELTTGSTNTAVGVYALSYTTTGSDNIAIGYAAGRIVSDNSPLTTNRQSIFIGKETKASAVGVNNEVVIGHQAIGIGANSVVLGNHLITTTALRGNVGIGTDSPTSKLYVQGDNYTNSVLASFRAYQNHNLPFAEFVGGNDTATWLDITGGANVTSWSSGIRIQQADTTNRIQGFMMLGSAARGGSPAFSSPALHIASHRAGTASYAPIAFWTGGSQRMILTTDGKVGIGTTSPSNKLTVYDASQNYALRIGNNTANVDGAWSGLSIYNSTNQGGGSTGEGSAAIRAYRYSGRGELGNELEFRVGGTSVMRFDYRGYVGIGTDSPSEKLDVVGSVKATNSSTTVSAKFGPAGSNNAYPRAAFFIGSGNSNIANTALWVIPDGGLNKTTVLEALTREDTAQTDTRRAGIRSVAGGDNEIFSATGLGTGSSVNLHIKPNGISGSSAMTFNPNGNVGIGTTSPSTKLDVEGQASLLGNGFYGLLNLKGTNALADYNSANKIVMSSNGSTDGLYSGGLHFTRRNFNQQGDYGSGIRGLSVGNVLQDNALELYTSEYGDKNVTRLKITSDGKVGIGTTSPSDKLDVQEATLGDDILNVGYTSNLSTYQGTGTVLKATSTYNSTWNAYLPQVGIGTETPEYSLDIRQGGPFSAALNLQGSYAQNSYIRADSYYGTIEIHNKGWFRTREKNGQGGDFIVYTGLEGSTSWSAKFIVENSGRVGIGTTSPSGHLHVIDSGNLSSGGIYIENTGATSATLGLENTEGISKLFTNNGVTTLRNTRSGFSNYSIDVGGLGVKIKEGNGGQNSHASAILDLDSTTQGVLFPRMTEGDRTSIGSPATGLIVYQTDGDEGLYIYKSTGWIQII